MGCTVTNYIVVLSLSIILCLLRLSSDVASFKIRITPERVQSPKLSTVTVACLAEPREPISECQFRIWYVGKQDQGVHLNVTKGVNKQTILVPNPFYNVTNYFADLFGGKFDDGCCIVKLHYVKGDHLLVGCKLTTESNLSAIETMSVFFNKENPLELLKYNEVILAAPGLSVNVLLNTLKVTNLSKCTYSPVKEKNVVFTYANDYTFNKIMSYINGKLDLTPRYPPYGGSLSYGQCGFTINNVQEQDNGVFFVLAHSEDGSVGAQAVTLVVPGTQRPSVDMTFSKEPAKFDDGEVVIATCTARGFRLAATRWSWWWWNATSNTSEPIAEPQGQSVEGWSWPWEVAVVSQSVTVAVTQNRDRNTLVCYVQDAADAKRLAEKHRIIDIKKNTLTGDPKTWTLSISPAEFVTISWRDSKTVLCKADPGTKLSDCGFQLDIGGQGHYYNASLGSMGQGNVDFGPFSVKYHGRGLDQGECGIELKAPKDYEEGNFLLGCRARTENSGWKYNYTDIVEREWLPYRISLRTVPNLPFLLPGSNLTVQCNTYYKAKLKKCSFSLPGQKELDIDEKYKPQPPHNFQYVGAGLDQGHCGIFIPNASKLNMNKADRLTCETMVDGRTFPTRQISVIFVAPPTEDPNLKIVSPGFSNGPKVTFQCVAPASRPPASIAWFLGDERLTADKVREEPVDKWRWGRDKETTTQFATMTLTQEDEGKKLTCVTSHMALKKTKNFSLILANPNVSPTDGPHLTVTPNPYTQNTTVTFTCVAPASHPPANITLLSREDNVVTPVGDSELGVWRWWDKTKETTKNFTLNLEHIKAGTVITCVTSHLNVTRNSSVTITYFTNTKTDRANADNADIADNAENADNADSEEIEDNADDKDMNVNVILGVVAATLVVVTIVASIVFAFRKKQACFKGERETQEPVYEEINVALALVSRQPPPLPARPDSKAVKQMEVPVELAPARPEEPKYIDLLDPEDSTDKEDKDGYLEPIGRRAFSP